MHYWNLETPIIRRPEYVGAEPISRATWLNVGLYCVEQENGGRIIGARTWGDRRWQQTCGVTKLEVDAAAPLLVWEDEDLCVWAYPEDKEREVRDGRNYGSIGGKKSAEVRRAKAAAKASANPPLNPPLKSPATPPINPPLNGMEWKGMEGNGKKRNGKRVRGAPKGAETHGDAPVSHEGDGRKPASFESLVAFVGKFGAPESVAREFFLHYQANGWKQGGRAVLHSWQAQAEKWVNGWKRDSGSAPKKNASAGGVAGGGPADPANGLTIFEPVAPGAAGVGGGA